MLCGILYSPGFSKLIEQQFDKKGQIALCVWKKTCPKLNLFSLVVFCDLGKCKGLMELAVTKLGGHKDMSVHWLHLFPDLQTVYNLALHLKLFFGGHLSYPVSNLPKVYSCLFACCLHGEWWSWCYITMLFNYFISERTQWTREIAVCSAKAGK